MLKIAVAGASGRMGRMLVEAIAAAPDAVLSGALDRAGSDAIGQDAGAFLSLLGAVVAMLAKALEVASVEEQILIALVRFDVIHSIGSLYSAKSAAQAADRFSLQLMPAQPIPSLGLVEVMPRRSARH